MSSNSSLISQNLSWSFHPLNHPRANPNSYYLSRSRSRIRPPQTSSIAISELNPENSLTYKQLSEFRKNARSRADFNTSLLIGSRLLGKILSNAFVGLGYHVLNHYFFVFYAFVYLLLLMYLCCCVPGKSGIGQTREQRMARLKEDRAQSRAELFTLNEQAEKSRIGSQISLSNASGVFGGGVRSYSQIRGGYYIVEIGISKHGVCLGL